MKNFIIIILPLLIVGGCSTQRPVRVPATASCGEVGFDPVKGEIYKCVNNGSTYRCWRKPGQDDVCEAWR